MLYQPFPPTDHYRIKEKLKQRIDRNNTKQFKIYIIIDANVFALWHCHFLSAYGSKMNTPPTISLNARQESYKKADQG